MPTYQIKTLASAFCLSLLLAAACQQERVTAAAERPTSSDRRVTNISELNLPVSSTLGGVGECSEVTDRSLFPAAMQVGAGRTLRLVEPNAGHAVRRLLVTYDTTGRPLHISDVVFGVSSIVIDMHTGIGWVQTRSRGSNGRMSSSEWNGSAKEMLSEPQLGNPSARAASLLARCGGAR